MEDFIIRDARAEDIPALGAIERECFSQPWTEDMLRGQLREENHVFLVCEHSGAVVGYIGMMFVLDEGYISNVAVTGSIRGKGLGKALVTEMVSRCREKNLAFVTLEVRASNAPARKVYSACGFSDVGVRKNYYQQPKEDAVLMTCFL